MRRELKPGRTRREARASVSVFEAYQAREGVTVAVRLLRPVERAIRFGCGFGAQNFKRAGEEERVRRVVIRE